jgi:hypothetical protein
MKSVCLLALLGLIVPCAASATEFSLGRPVALMRERNSFANVAIGDINNDGRDDLAATAAMPDVTHRVSLFLQRADGTLALPVQLALPFGSNAHTFPVKVVDLDHDGAGEIVVGTEGNGLMVVRMSGTGELSAVAHPTSRGCKFLTAGDVNGDGNADVVCHDWKETATVFYGNGSGGFSSTLNVHTPAGTYDFDWKHLRLADVTGDDRPDLLVAASTVNSFFVMPNNGFGGFWPASVYTHPWRVPRVGAATLEVLDLDGDGINEVVTANPDNRPGASLNVYRRQANGYLALTGTMPVYDSTTALLAGDVDGDGDDELLAGHFTFSAVTLLGAGTTGLANQARYDLPGFGIDIAIDPRQGHSNSIALGDLNHDGCKDLAAATYSGVIALYGCRPFTPKVPVSDFDGDGVSDLLWAGSGTGETYLWQWADLIAWYECVYQLGNKTGNSMCPRSIGQTWSAQAIGDFDGDGSSDVFWRDSASGANGIWNRALYPRDVTTVTSQDWQVVGAGDFDGDDRSDLLWRNTANGSNGIWKSGDSTTQQAVASMSDQRWKVAAVGDFDGDRKSDILWRHSTTGSNAIWRSGRVESLLAVTPVSDLRWTVVGVGDFNGDGKDDVVWRHTGTGTNGIWLSANSAVQQAVTGVTNQAWIVAAVGDYDGDGRADLMWRNGSNGNNLIWSAADSKKTRSVASMSPPTRVVR